MPTVTDIAHVAHVSPPQFLRDLPGWLIWRYEANDNPGGKPRKVPYYCNGGRRHGQQGRPEDRAQLCHFDAARAAAARRGFNGVGFAPLADFGVVALDFDDCLVDGEPHADLVPIIASTYAEYSPSGNGIRAFYRGQFGNLKNSPAKPFGLEVFSSKGFVTFTGAVLPATELMGLEDTVAELTDEARGMIRQRFKKDVERQAEPAAYDSEPLGLTRSQIDEALDVLPTDLSYDDWIQVGMALHHETRGEGFHMWDEWSHKSSKFTTSDYGLERWKSFGHHGGAIVTARSLVRLANEHGAHINLNAPASAEEFENVAIQQSEVGAPADAKRPRFQPIPVAAFASRPPPRWIVKGVIPQAELVVLYGESGSGKSFIALDLSAAVARGLPWRSSRVKGGRVVYIAAEGAGGFRNRCVAYGLRQQIDLLDLPLEVIPECPNLLAKDDALAIAKAIGPAHLIIVDTFAQVMPGGDENSAEDMGKALSHCKGIHRATGATVLLVHHSGKDASRGARGWSGLRAAADAELEVSRQGAGRLLRISKQKDGDDSAEWGFGLEPVQIGQDEDGDAITSCVVTEQQPPRGRLLRALGPVEEIVNAVLQEFALGQLAGIEVEAVLAETIRRLPVPEQGKRDLRRQRSRQALKSLLEADGVPYFLESDNTVTIL